MTLIAFALAAMLAQGRFAARDSLPVNPIKDAKSVIAFFSTGHADSVQHRMTAEAQQRRTAAQRDSLWHVLVSQVGPFRHFGATRVEPRPDGGRTVVLELVFAAQPVQASLIYDASGQISSVVFDAH